MAITALDQLAVYRQNIDQALVAFFDDLPQLLTVKLSDYSRSILETLQAYALRPGKRIRGAVAAAVYDDTVQQQLSPIGLQLAVALELIQDYLLIIDDVMDKSDTRRGEPTLQHIFDTKAADFGGDHEANMTAINIGVLTQHLANIALLRPSLPSVALQQVMLQLHSNVSITAFGQLDDLYQRPGRSITEADIIHKYSAKSSYYTFINPLQLGLAAANVASPEQLKACVDFGEPAGIAFQLHDDYLGVFGASEATGKSTLDDIHEGKYTLLMHTALHRATPAAKQQLLTILGNSAATAADLHSAQTILTDSGAVEYTQKLANSYAATAKQSLVRQPIGSMAFQQMLNELLDYSVIRQQ